MKINVGCGNTKLKGYVNIDCRESVGPDMVVDITKSLPFPDDSIEEILALDCLEHIPTLSTIAVMDEFWRVLVPNGNLVIQVPDAEHGQGAFMDPTHINFWAEGRFLYFCHPAYRKYYDTKAHFEMINFKRSLTDPAMRVYHLRAELKAVKHV